MIMKCTIRLLENYFVSGFRYESIMISKWLLSGGKNDSKLLKLLTRFHLYERNLAPLWTLYFDSFLQVEIICLVLALPPVILFSFTMDGTLSVRRVVLWRHTWHVRRCFVRHVRDGWRINVTLFNIIVTFFFFFSYFYF